MAKHHPLSRLKSRLKQSLMQALMPVRPSAGFTLLELLVVAAIASGIIAGLMYIVVELMGTDQRESSRSETQREMQMALNYISTELRESVYTYTGEDLQCMGLPTACRPLADYLPLGANSVPVLAFWKQQPFPDNVPGSSARASCYGSAPPGGISCLAGHSYALVVYSMSKANPNNLWSASNARITRYALTEFDSQGNLNPGYVNPGTFGNFATWPFGRDTQGTTSTPVDLRLRSVLSGRPAGAPTGNPAVLVDFVDTQARQTGSCPSSYAISPTDASLASTGFTGVRSFYACVSVRPTTLTSGVTTIDTGVNQDMILFLQGNANGRPGIIGDSTFLPALETRVLSRGVLTKRPSN